MIRYCRNKSRKINNFKFSGNRITSSILAAIVIALTFAHPVWANSGPVYWQGYPSSDVLAITNNSAIVIEKENLVFDFSDSTNTSYSLNGRVTATYEMANPTDTSLAVQMAFPYIGTLTGPLKQDIVIKNEDIVLPYTLYAGDIVGGSFSSWQEGNETKLDFAAIVSTITDAHYKAENFAESEIGKQYILTVQPSAGEKVNLAVGFSFDPKKTRVLTNGFNRYERDDRVTRIAAWCYEPRDLEIFVLGEDIELHINGYTDGELKNKTEQFNHQFAVYEVDLRHYVMGYIEKNTHVQDLSLLEANQLLNLYAKSLDKAFSQNSGYAAVDELGQLEDFRRILTLVYTLEFPAQSKQKLSVSYTTTGTMDKTKTVKPLYSFDYILNPAQYWHDFKDLDIKIITPHQAPYVISSTIELIKGENNVYTASMNALPEDDLSFTLYAYEQVGISDQVSGYLNQRFGYFTPVLAGVAVVVIMVLIVSGIVCKRV